MDADCWLYIQIFTINDPLLSQSCSQEILFNWQVFFIARGNFHENDFWEQQFSDVFYKTKTKTQACQYRELKNDRRIISSLSPFSFISSLKYL